MDVPVGSNEHKCLSFKIHATHLSARTATLTLAHGPTVTPIFMPVGTSASVKGLSGSTRLGGTRCEMLLSNTYHLGQRPTTKVVEGLGGIHAMMGLPKGACNVLTDSGGFQMVSLAALSKVTEEGVWFESPITGKLELLTPEVSISHQHEIGADICMALDDVVSSVVVNDARFREATDRTLRWLDRCIAAHEPRSHIQALFPIVQGGLDVSPGGLRDVCLAGFAARDAKIPGYAIGGLAGGESKDHFWRVVAHCARALPASKPRYLMGVGDPLDIVVCVALGVDMFDCVYPTRTARFGTALTRYGTMSLRSKEARLDLGPVERGCECRACKADSEEQVSRALFHAMFAQSGRSTTGAALLSHHNVSYMLRLCDNMKAAIETKTYPAFAHAFLRDWFGGEKGHPQWRDRVPVWVKEALAHAGMGEWEALS